MRTSTSIGSLVYGLLGRILRSPRTAGRKEHFEPLGYGLRHELVHPSAERGDLLHAARRDEADGRARHHVDRLDLRRERSVELVHLELPLEVRDDAKPLDDRLRLPLAREVDDELAEDVDLDVLDVRDGLVQERDSLLEGEHRRFVVRTPDDADDDAVEDSRRAFDHVDVTERHRVVRTWADRGDQCPNSVTRALPYLREVRSSSGSFGSMRALVSKTSSPSSARTSGRYRASVGCISS